VLPTVFVKIFSGAVKMKIVLTTNLPYFPAHGGANTSNRYLLEGFVRNNHSLLVVVPALSTPGHQAHAELLDELKTQGMNVTSEAGVEIFNLNGVEVHAVVEPSRLRKHLMDQIRRFNPDWTLVSSEDPSQNLLDAALKQCPGRVVYLARTAPFLPFGPNAFFPSAARTKLLGQVAAIVAVSEYVGNYIRQWSSFEPVVLPISFYGDGPFSDFGCFDKGFVTMINPCAVKGLSIFVALARALPDVQFAAVPTWGTTDADLATLKQVPNIQLLKPTENIDEIYSQSRIILVPSLVAEGKSRVILEAMLRGIPVLASDSGGNAEAKLDTDFLLPVRLIRGFGEQLDGKMLPIPTIPEQDIGLWLDALRRLLSDRKFYNRLSSVTRTVALKFVADIDVAALQNFLLQLKVKTQTDDGPSSDPNATNLQSRSTSFSGIRASLTDLTPQQQALLTLRLRKKAASRTDQPTRSLRLERVSRDKQLRASFAQERQWFLDQLEPGNSFHNMASTVRLRGPLNTRILEQSLNKVIRRHETLRTCFDIVDGYPVQVIKQYKPASLQVTDLSCLPESERQTEARQLAAVEETTGFDLARGPLMRASVLRLGDEDHVLLMTMHHVISDAWSMKILLNEMVTLYTAFLAGKESPLPELPIQYADFAYWQRQGLEGEALKEHLSYWKEQLSGAPGLLNLPTDRPRPNTPTFLSQGALRRFKPSVKLSGQLYALSHKEAVTPFILLLAAFSTLLCRYSRQLDVIVGCNIANRNRSETEGLIGFFVNMLPLRSNFSGDPSFREILQRVREVALGAYTHQDLPFERMIAEVMPERDPNRMPLVQVIFDYQAAPAVSPEVGALKLERFASGTPAKNFDMIDMTLHMENVGDRMYGELIYSTDLYNEASIVRLLENFGLLLQAVGTNPEIKLSQLKQILDDADRQHDIARKEEFKHTKQGTLRSVKPKSVRLSVKKGELHHDQTTT
jgi:glycosyltransferase involved in cell wall biosynthesis